MWAKAVASTRWIERFGQHDIHQLGVARQPTAAPKANVILGSGEALRIRQRQSAPAGCVPRSWPNPDGHKRTVYPRIGDAVRFKSNSQKEWRVLTLVVSEAALPALSPDQDSPTATASMTEAR